MGGVEGLLAMLDTRSFSSMWFWLLLAGWWSWVGRGALGIPSELVRAVRRGDGGPEDRGPEDGTAGNATRPRPESLLLLDWVSLTAPRWRVQPRDATVLIAVASFLVSALAVLGFFYGFELAQALVLLGAPLLLLGLLRMRLAARLRDTLRATETGQLDPDGGAKAAAVLVARHLRTTAALSMMAVAVAAIWGTRWLALHPNGL